MTVQGLLLVFLGGGLGSVLRSLISWMMKSQSLLKLPVATLVSNIISVIILSLVYMHIQQKTDDKIRLFLIVGFCGGLSTFSTFSFETMELFRRGEHAWAWGNIVFNNALCIAITFLLIKDAAVK